MMTEKTLELIAVCKNNGFNRHDNIRENIIDYLMAKYHPHTNRNLYTENFLNEYVNDVFYEYIDNCDKPSAVLTELDILNTIETTDTPYYVKISAVLHCSQVQKYDSDEYVNGFTKEIDYIIDKVNNMAEKYYSENK